MGIKNQLEGKKFLFVTGASGREKLMVEIAKELKSRHNVDSYFFSCAVGNTMDFFKSEEIDKEKVFILFEKPVRDTIQLFKSPKKAPDLEYLRAKEDQYDFNSFDLWQISAPRRKSRLKAKGIEVLSLMEHITRKTEEVIEKVKPDYAFLTGISGSVYIIAYKEFLEKKIPVLELINARIPGKFSFDNKLKAQWPLLIKNYNKLKEKGLTKEEETEAKEFVNDFRETPFKPDNSMIIKESIKDKIKKYSSYGKTMMYRKAIPNFGYFFWYPIKDRLMKNSSKFKQPVEGEKYVFFPLQIQPEASTSVRGKWYINQLALIENISKSIPCDYKLYVKEHMKNFSKRPRGFHKEIIKLPNARLISPLCNTIDLIKKSSLVTTITGTIGWESILLQKPVLTFGEVFYNSFDEVTRVKEIDQLPAIIKQKLDKETPTKKTLEFVAAVQKSTFPGIAALPGGCQNRSLTKENIGKLADGIEGYIKQIKV